MLYDQTILQARVLALMAWADGTFDDAERLFFRDFLDASPCTDALRIELLELADAAPDRAQVLEDFGRHPRAVCVNVLLNAYLMALANERLDVVERKLLDDLARRAGAQEALLARLEELLAGAGEAPGLEQALFGS